MYNARPDNRIRKGLAAPRWLALCLMLLLVALPGGPAFAAAPPAAGVKPTQLQTSCLKLDQGGIVTKAIVCLRQSVGTTTTVLQSQFATFMAKTVRAACALCLVFFGLKMLTGHIQNLLPESSNLIFRVALVLLLTANFDQYYPAFFSAIDLVIGVISRAMGTIPGCPLPSGNITSNGTDVELWIGAIKQKLAASDMGPWLMLDCVFDRLFSFKVIVTAGVSGLILLLGAVFLLNSIGVMIFTLIVSAAMSYMFMAVRSILLVLMAYLSIAFLVVISPMIIPTFLFKDTTRFFTNWLGLIISAIMQPIFILSFLAFASVVVVSLSYDGKYYDQDCEEHVLFGGSPTGVQPLSVILPKTPLFMPKRFNLLNLTGDYKTYVDMLKKMGVVADDVPPEASFFDWLKQKMVNAGAKTGAWLASKIINVSKLFVDVGFTVQVPVLDLRPDVNQQKMYALAVTLGTMVMLIILISRLMHVVPMMAHQITAMVGVALFYETTRIAVGSVDAEVITQKTLGSMDKRMRAKLSERTGVLSGTIGGGVSGGFRGAVSGFQAGFSRGGIAGGLRGVVSGGTAGGLRGARQGLKEGVKTSVTKPISAVARSVPAALKGAWNAARGREE